MGAFIDLKKEFALNVDSYISDVSALWLRDAVSHNLLFRKRYSTTVCGAVKQNQCDVPQSLVLGSKAFILHNSDICKI